MNLASHQPQSSAVQQEKGLFSVMLPEAFVTNAVTIPGKANRIPETETNLPAGTLGLLASRLDGMNKKNNMLQEMIADRDARMAQMEQENTILHQQVALFTATNSQVIDSLAEVLKRFPGGAYLSEEVGKGSVYSDD